MRISRLLLFVGCGVSLAALTGCVIPLLALGAGGYAVFKTTQKGTVKITFAAPTIQDTNALAAIRSVAVWPEQKAGVMVISDVGLAEQLSSSNTLAVATPLTVLHILETNSLPVSAEEMTADEQRHLFKTVAGDAGVDAVFFASPAGTKTSYGNLGSAVGIQGASATQSIAMTMYSRQKDAVVWQEVVDVKSAMAGKSDNGAEAQKDCTEEVAKRILQMTGKDGAVQALSSNP